MGNIVPLRTPVPGGHARASSASGAVERRRTANRHRTGRLFSGGREAQDAQSQNARPHDRPVVFRVKKEMQTPCRKPHAFPSTKGERVRAHRSSASGAFFKDGLSLSGQVLLVSFVSQMQQKSGVVGLGVNGYSSGARRISRSALVARPQDENFAPAMTPYRPVLASNRPRPQDFA